MFGFTLLDPTFRISIPHTFSHTFHLFCFHMGTARLNRRFVTRYGLFHLVAPLGLGAMITWDNHSGSCVWSQYTQELVFVL